MPLNNILEVEFLMYWVLIVWVILFVLSISSTFCLQWIMYLNGFKLLLFLPRMLRLCFKFLEKKFFFLLDLEPLELLLVIRVSIL